MNRILVGGIVQGAYYAMIAIGFAIIFGIAKMFNLAVGGYYVAGAFTAWWLFKAMYMSFNTLTISNYGGTELVMFALIKYLPLFLFVVLIVSMFKLFDIKYAIVITLVQFLSFYFNRILIVSMYESFSYEATLLAVLIPTSIMIFSLGLYYIELSQKQIFISILFLDALTLGLNTMSDFARSPGVYIAIVLLSTIIVATLSVLIDRYLLDDIRDNQTIILIITFGLALLIQSVIPFFKYPSRGEFIDIGNDPKSLGGIIPLFRRYEILGHTIQAIRVIAAGVSIFLIILIYYFIKKTPTGRALEAVSEDPEAAWLVGINVRKIYLISAGIGMGVTAIAGILTSPFDASPSWGIFMGWRPLIFAIAVVTLGGIGSIFGSAIAGFILGLTESTINEIYPDLGEIVPLLMIFAIIIIRPNGLFGKEEDEE